jgi:hypothetical protein
VVEDRFGRPDAERHVDEDARCARPSADATGLMNQLANPFVARPREAKALGVAAHAPAGLGDGVGALVMADNGLEERHRKSRSECRHLTESRR